MFLYLLFVVVGFASGEEEQCSKTLEMMIRMEIRMEEMERKLNASVTEQPTTEPKERTIAFFATLENSKLHGVNQRIVFENVVTNVGNAYDPTTGNFRAPTAGTYVFFSTVMGTNNVELWNYIAVNENPVAYFHSRGALGRHDDGTATAILLLNKKDTVSVKNLAVGGYTHGFGYTRFSGHKLNNKN